MTVLILTATEQRVAHLVAAGRSNAEIAAELGVNGKTVEVHISRACRKVGASSLTELASWTRIARQPTGEPPPQKEES